MFIERYERIQRCDRRWKKWSKKIKKEKVRDERKKDESSGRKRRKKINCRWERRGKWREGGEQGGNRKKWDEMRIAKKRGIWIF